MRYHRPFPSHPLLLVAAFPLPSYGFLFQGSVSGGRDVGSAGMGEVVLTTLPSLEFLPLLHGDRVLGFAVSYHWLLMAFSSCGEDLVHFGGLSVCAWSGRSSGWYCGYLCFRKATGCIQALSTVLTFCRGLRLVFILVFDLYFIAGDRLLDVGVGFLLPLFSSLPSRVA